MRMRQQQRHVFLPVDHSPALLLRRMRRQRIQRRMRQRQLPVDHPSALLLRRFRWKQRLRMRMLIPTVRI
jgi:hypothetical protein